MIENAQKHGCDPSKLCVTGESGGGWITMGSMILLSRDEGSKCKNIKLMLLTCPMLGYMASQDVKREDVKDWEKPAWPFRKDDFEMHTTDIQSNINDPLLFPYILPVNEL